jgi:hypothetical protein
LLLFDSIDPIFCDDQFYNYIFSNWWFLLPYRIVLLAICATKKSAHIHSGRRIL